MNSRSVRTGHRRLKEPPGSRSGVFVIAHQNLDPAAGARGAASERPVGRGADPHGVEPRARSQPAQNLANHFAFKTDVAVGQEDNLPLRIGPQRLQRFQDGAGHLCRAAGLKSFKRGEGLPDVLRACLHGLGNKRFHII